MKIIEMTNMDAVVFSHLLMVWKERKETRNYNHPYVKYIMDAEQEIVDYISSLIADGSKEDFKERCNESH